jgi:hypothetical protein
MMSANLFMEGAEIESSTGEVVCATMDDICDLGIRIDSSTGSVSREKGAEICRGALLGSSNGEVA